MFLFNRFMGSGPGDRMRSTREFHARVAPFVLAGALALPCPAWAADPPREKPPAPAARIAAMLYCVEFDKTCGPPIYPGTLGGIVTSSAPRARWRFRTGGPAPLVSREAVQYSAVGTSGETSLPTARIFAEIGAGGELSYRSDKGKNIVLQVDVKTVCWDIDQTQAMALAKKAGAERVLVAVLRSEDLTSQVNSSGQYGSQKSFAVNLELTLIDPDSGEVIGSFSDETRVMGLSATGAVRRAARTLVDKGLSSLSAES